MICYADVGSMLMDSISLAVTFVAFFAIEQTYCQGNIEEEKGNQNSFLSIEKMRNVQRKRSEKHFINCF